MNRVIFNCMLFLVVILSACDEDSASEIFDASISITSDKTTYNEGDGTILITASSSLTNTSGSDITVNYTVSGTATSAEDFEELSGSLVILEGASEASLNITLIDDSADEEDETIILTLSDVDGDVTASGAVTLTINDNDSGTTTTDDCTTQLEVDQTRGECGEDHTSASLDAPTFTNVLDEANDIRTITTNSIPDHKFGLFGKDQGALNPNAITVQSQTFELDATPELAGETTELLSMTSGPAYSFGIVFSGIELDPLPAEPWPHTVPFTDPSVNWEWNMEAVNLDLGFDCNNAHVQPQGKYHYHGFPSLYIETLSLDEENPGMTLVGYAADGFPIYYKYGYSTADNSSSDVKSLTSGFTLRSGEREGDGVTAPCGDYNGTYSNDYEYIEGQGDLDECNGRTGVTPEYPDGTYYYVLTETFPVIPRCFKGTPSNEFAIN
ncbi:YHYH protein [Reichenbachiella sp.]|uniref:YHYH protein n=1 Tax=Reichenbachiella sp. TaxID=2184521 RepID=UPI0032971F48